jgi:hypothetical protein
LKNTLEEAGFEMKPPKGGPPPMGQPGGMGGVGWAGAEPPQFTKDFMDKVQSGDISEEDVTEFVKTVNSQNQQSTGLLFNQTV